MAGELLGDGRSALYPAAAVDADLERASDADRVDAGVRPKAPVLDRDHRLAHDRRNLVEAQPFAEARAQRDDDGAVIGPPADHLTAVVTADELAGSQERRVGKECVSTCRARWSPQHSKKK